MTLETTNGIGKTEIFTEGSLQPGTTNFCIQPPMMIKQKHLNVIQQQ